MFNEPVCKDSFFDRADILSVLDKRVNALKKGYRQNIALLGIEGIGKTSCIYNYLTYHKDPLILPIYVGLREGESFKQFAARFTGALLYSYLSLRLPTNIIDQDQDIDLLTGRASVYLPDTVNRIKRIREVSKDPAMGQEVFNQLFELPSAICSETDVSCLLILDEFHLLKSMRIKNPYDALGKKIMVQKSVMYIVVSSKVVLAKRLLREEMNLLFGNFEVIEVGPFDDATADRFLMHRMSDLLTQQQRQFLIYITSGHPFYLDVITTRMKERVRQLALNSIMTEDIVEILKSLLFDPRGCIHSYLYSKLTGISSNGRAPASYISILTAIAHGNKRLPDISSHVGCSVSETYQRLNKLSETGTIFKNASFYTLTDSLFRFWLECVHSRAENSFILNPELNSQRFIEDVKKMLIHFAQGSSQPIDQRILWLFKHMESEPVYIDGKRFRLTEFRSVKPLKSSPEIFYLEDISTKIVWVCAIKENYLTEQEVTEFINATAQLNIRPAKKIIIALSGVDENAGLLAKEKKCLLWELNHMNMLLDLYGGQKIIK